MDKPGRMLHLWSGRIKVERRLIPEYFTDFYNSALEHYGRFRRYGLPFAGGYEEQPGWYIELMDVFANVEAMRPAKDMSGANSRRATSNNRRQS